MYNLLCWNIFKLKKDGSENDLHKLLKRVDFACLQEYTSNFKSENIFYKSLNYTFTIPYNNIKTGTATLSKIEPHTVHRHRTSDLELGLVTPKSWIVSIYKIENKHLQLLNIHALNFVTNGTWKKELRKILKSLDQDLPTIVCGDFNTWNSSRLSYMEKIFLENGFKYQNYSGNFLLRLDHVFSKKIKNITVQALQEDHFSDHLPLLVNFDLS